MADAAAVRWHVHAAAADLLEAVVALVAGVAQEAIATRGAFHVVLAGGSTPEALYRRLRDLRTDWSAWHVYFGDERCLPAGDAGRNDHMARAALLDAVAIPPAQIHAIPTELGAEAAAEHYARVLADRGDFDLVLLGLGEDGHTASLFPGDETGFAPDAPAAVPVHRAPKPPADRVSLSAARLAAAERVVFLVTGAGKQEPVSRWRAGESIPAARIRPMGGVDVYLDSLAWADAPGSAGHAALRSQRV